MRGQVCWEHPTDLLGGVRTKTDNISGIPPDITFLIHLLFYITQSHPLKLGIHSKHNQIRMLLFEFKILITVYWVFDLGYNWKGYNWTPQSHISSLLFDVNTEEWVPWATKQVLSKSWLFIFWKGNKETFEPVHFVMTTLTMQPSFLSQWNTSMQHL